MNKKFISAFMLGLLALGTTSTITSCKDYDGDLSDVKNSVNSLTNDLKALQDAYKAADTALETKIANAEAALKDAIAKKADQTTVDALKSNLESNYYQKSVIDSKLEAIEKIINDTKTQLNADIVAKYNALQGEIAGVDKKLGDKYSDLLEQITYIYGDLNNVDNELEAYIDAVKADLVLQTEALAGAEVRIAAIEAMLADYPAVKAQVADNKEKIAKLISDLNAANSKVANCATKSELTDAVQEIQTKIEAVSPALDGLSICISKRPTSIVFEPTTFVNGIEAITFATLNYQDWGKQTRDESRQGYPENDNWYADAAPANAKLTYIDKDNAIAEYRVNPILGNNQWEQSVAEISTLVHNATNEISRAADYENLITVSETKYENGVLTVKLHKNTTEDFSDKIENIGLNKDKETFKLMSIKAKLTDNALTAEEKANNALVYVYSDWCRIVQETVKPYIHQKNSNFHFLRFSDIYNEGNLASIQTKRPGALVTSEKVNGMYDKKKIATVFDHFKTYGNRCMEVNYTETLDLKELVSVCTNHATIQDYKARGLDFMFNLVQFDVWDGNINSYTDESSYAVIENGVIRATGIKGEVGKQLSDGVQNPSAVGRTPVVQIVLMDKANDQVVDVQYMMVRWTEPAKPEENMPVPELGQDETTTVYNCGVMQIKKILDLEQYFTQQQLTNQQFRALYGQVYDNKIYSSNEIKNGVPQGKVIGTAEYWKGEEHSNTSDQIEWIVTSDENSELEAQLKATGKAEVTGWILLTSAPGVSPTKAIKVTATFTYDLTQHKVTSYANGVNYIEGQWTKNGGELNTENENKYITCSVLPYEAKSIYADYKTTVIGHDVATGFINNGSSYSTNNYTSMFANKTDAQLVFDNKEERLEILKSEGFDIVGAAGWNVSPNGKTLYYGNVVAATIDGTQVKLAESNWAQTGSLLNKPARALLGKKVAVKFNADYIYFCEETKNTVVDKFLVYFEKPLSWTEEDVVIALTDQTHYGDAQKVNLDKLFTVTEAWGNNTNVVWGVQPTGQKPTVAELKPWYGIDKVEIKGTPYGWAGKEWIKLDDAKTNFNPNGSIDATCKNKLSALKNQDGTQKYVLLWNGEQGANAEFIFFEQTNAGGTSQTLSQQLVIEVNAYLAGKYFLTENDNQLVGKIKVTVDPKQTSKKK